MKKKESEVPPSFAPDPDRETPDPVPLGLIGDLEELLADRYSGALEEGEHIRVRARTGRNAAWLRARVGTDQRAHEIELFARDVEGEALDGALGVLVDFLDGVLEELFAAARDAYLPLDYSPRRFDDHVVFARSEVRDFAAEAAADALLEGRSVRGPEEAQ